MHKLKHITCNMKRIGSKQGVFFTFWELKQSISNISSLRLNSVEFLTLNWYCYSLQLDCSEGVGVWFLLTDMISYCHIEWCSKLSPRDMKKQALQVWRKQFTRVRKPFVKRGYFGFFLKKCQIL